MIIARGNYGDANELDDQLMQMVLQNSANEYAFVSSGADFNEDALLEQAIQESMRENPNPDNMSYEELSQLTEDIGNVSKGYPESMLSRLRSKANFDYVNED